MPGWDRGASSCQDVGGPGHTARPASVLGTATCCMVQLTKEPGVLNATAPLPPSCRHRQVCSREEADAARAAVEERLRAKGDLSDEQVAALLTPEVRRPLRTLIWAGRQRSWAWRSPALHRSAQPRRLGSLQQLADNGGPPFWDHELPCCFPPAPNPTLPPNPRRRPAAAGQEDQAAGEEGQGARERGGRQPGGAAGPVCGQPGAHGPRRQALPGGNRHVPGGWAAPARAAVTLPLCIFLPANVHSLVAFARKRGRWLGPSAALQESALQPCFGMPVALHVRVLRLPCPRSPPLHRLWRLPPSCARASCKRWAPPFEVGWSAPAVQASPCMRDVSAGVAIVNGPSTRLRAFVPALNSPARARLCLIAPTTCLCD